MWLNALAPPDISANSYTSNYYDSGGNSNFVSGYVLGGTFYDQVIIADNSSGYDLFVVTDRQRIGSQQNYLTIYLGGDNQDFKSGTGLKQDFTITKFSGFTQAYGQFQTRNGPSSAVAEFNLTKLTVSQVPIPAAAWLFDSALAGLFGIGKLRKRQAD